MHRRRVIEKVVATSFAVTTSRDGDETVHANLLDGTVLLVTKPCPRKMRELAKGAPDESYHREHSDAELPEPKQETIK